MQLAFTHAIEIQSNLRKVEAMKAMRKLFTNHEIDYSWVFIGTLVLVSIKEHTVRDKYVHMYLVLT